jgi:hypothetical protein
VAVIDPRNLRVADAVRLLNSTPLGEVVQPHVLYRHANRAGLRICAAGDPRRIDLIRYAAWLFHVRREGQRISGTPGDYGSMKEEANQRNRSISESARDIAQGGWVHPPKNPQRKKACIESFRGFCEFYFPQTFHLAWSDDHLKVVRKIETAVLEGGLFAMAMPRGSGKTSLCEVACLWALVYGHREFVALIGSDEEHAADMLDSIRSEMENNDLLEEDFSEVCGPIRALEGIHQRAAGQLYQGARTHVQWTNKEIVLPTIDGSVASGAIVKVAGITGRIRGMKHKRVDGKTTRPALVLLDDPQTDESARSPSQCATREQILAGAILGLAGPGRKIAGLMTLTVVRPDDMADRILDRDKHPSWQGERTKMVYAFPTPGGGGASGGEKLWQQYAQILADGFRSDQGIGAATEFYRQHQAAMDEGAVVAWPQRFNPDELSALQHAMNLKFRDERAFFAEYQNEPLLTPGIAEGDPMDADAIAGKTNGMPRGSVPVGVQHLTMFVDVQATLLFWMVCGWEANFTGYVLDYGAYPDQKRAYFTLRDARRTLQVVHPGMGQEGVIYAGLQALTGQLLRRQWRRDDGAAMTIERVLVDANWGNSTDVVYQFCRQSPHAALLMPSHGRYVGAASRPFSEYNRRPGDRLGLHWHVTAAQNKRGLRYLLFDANYWKSFVHARLAVALGDPGCLSLFAPDAACGGASRGGSGGGGSGGHRLLAEHLTAEYRVRTQGRGREVDEWKLRTPGGENHWFDGLVGCAVAGSMQGAVLFGTDSGARPVRKRVSFAAQQREMRARQM